MHLVSYMMSKQFKYPDHVSFFISIICFQAFHQIDFYGSGFVTPESICKHRFTWRLPYT